MNRNVWFTCGCWMTSILLAAGIAAASQESYFEMAARAFEEANRLADSRQYPEARAKFEESSRLYDEVAKRDPKNKAAALSNRDTARKNALWTYGADGYDKTVAAKALFDEKKYGQAAVAFDAALAAYELAVQMVPDDPGSRNNLKFVRIKGRVCRGMDAVLNRGTAPALSLPDLQGRIVRTADWKGKAMLVEFWAVWCPSCQELTPVLNDLYRRYKEKGLVVLGLNVDKTEAYGKNRSGEVGDFVKTKVGYPVLWAGDETLWDFGGIPFIPDLFLIGKDGAIVRRFTHEEQTRENLEKIIRGLLDR